MPTSPLWNGRLVMAGEDVLGVLVAWEVGLGDGEGLGLACSEGLVDGDVPATLLVDEVHAPPRSSRAANSDAARHHPCLILRSAV